MKKMLPLVVYILTAVVCQVVTVLLAIAIEQLGFKWASVIVFGILYIVMFAVAWKLTVLIVDGVLVRRGLVEA